MLRVVVNQVSKKYVKQWVLRDFSCVLEPGKIYAITGANGSGKSTLLKIIAGYLSPNLGTVIYYDEEQHIEPESIAKLVSMSAPYLELPEELTLGELLLLHQNLRGLWKPIQDIIAELEIDVTKEIRHCSSGMKQRIKLALAFFTPGKLLLLDEPTTNFDERWKAWYLDILKRYSQNRTVVICSNEPTEYALADDLLFLPA